jgi:SAM-dependent methyltransferase
MPPRARGRSLQRMGEYQETKSVTGTIRPLGHTPVVQEVARDAAQTAELAEFKRRVRGTWAAGDYPAVARRDLWPLGGRIVELAGVRPGERVLDVACGSGNAAIRAARAGAHVTGVDLTPELFDAGRRLAAEAGVEVDWVEGDAEALPFHDESFDVVVSVLGVMFAPRHRVAAHELARVLRPGGRLALINWAADSRISQIFGTVARYLPPPPPSASPPPLWGSEEYVRSLFTGTGLELRFEHAVHEFPPFASGLENLEFHARTFGPFIRARELLEPAGRWTALRNELLALHKPVTTSEYLVVLGHKPHLAP